MAIKDSNQVTVASSTRPRILYLDAYDSFSNNIIAQVEQCVDAEVVKLYIDDSRFKPSDKANSAAEHLRFPAYLQSFDAVIAGPGPGWANDDNDIGLIQELWKLKKDELLPVLGICLGFQSLALAFGAKLTTLKEPRHGMVSDILHKGRSIFDGVDQLLAVQYHSLQADIGHTIQTNRAVRSPGELWRSTEQCPSLEPLAWDFDSKKNGAVLMAVRHTENPFWGVQFHPESICTNIEGARIIQNWWESALVWNTKRALSEPIGMASDLESGQPGENMTIDGLRDIWGRQHRDIAHIDDPRSAEDEAKDSVRELVRVAKKAYGPRKIFDLIVHGDCKSLPGYMPVEVQCMTIGSGRLAVSDVCEVLDIPRNEAIVLESGLQSDLLPLKVGTGRYSIIGLVVPGETARLHYYAGRKLLQLRDGFDKIVYEAQVEDVWYAMKKIVQWLKPDQTPLGPTFAPFWGGLMGYVSYEAGLETINIRQPSTDPVGAAPDICFAYITRSIVFDHQVKKIYVQSIRGSNDTEWVENTLEKIYEAVGQKSAASTPSPMPRSDPFDAISQDPMLDAYIASITSTIASSATYQAKVERCQEFISQGHSYELCLTNNNHILARKAEGLDMSALNNELSWKLYNRLTKQNPAPFGAYVRLHNVHILSSSPERYISWDRNGSAQCRPIKGTVQKSRGTTAADAEAILSSSKERAENLMIVDLVRHQLHGVYGAGNVHVTQLMEIEEYETLWQLVSVVDAVPPGVQKARTPDEWEEPIDYVTGKKAPPRNSSLGFDAFVQSLPPGSMTGAPKKRSCEILNEIEGGARRGIYSGVLGYLDVGGGGDFSVVIRTAVKVDGENDGEEDVWTIGAGGAVTTQSVPESEYEEMVGKFNSTARAFRA